MAVYTVHEPAPRKGASSVNPEDAVFVRDGFYFWAFVLGPVWLLWRRLWLVLVLYLLVWAGIEAGMWYGRIGTLAQVLVGLALALLLGLEASTLWRWTLDRRGWTQTGVVVGEGQEAAERRYFAGRGQLSPDAAATKPAGYTSYGPKSSSEVIGLFPEPGGKA